MLDLDTFIIMIYVFVDDWYQSNKDALPARPGRKAKFSDSEALTIAIMSEWRAGVCWISERGCLRYLHRHYKSWFPNLPQRSAFNERKRNLLGVLNQLNQALIKQVKTVTDIYECVDCLPLPACSVGQYSRDNGHWLWDSTIGYGKGEWFFGDHLLASVSTSGAITGWLVGAAHINDRWLMEAFLSARQGDIRLLGPPHRPKDGIKSRRLPPIGFIGAWFAVGHFATCPYLADKGFNGYRWQDHWLTHFKATVISVPPDNATQQKPWTARDKHWLASHRQCVETVFALLVRTFDIKNLNAHSRWGQYTRLTTKFVGYHLGILFNRLLGRTTWQHQTLLV